MALSTYAELQTAIADYLNRDDLGTVAKDFIALAEAQMQRELEHWRMEKRATVTLTDRYVILPSDFLSPVRLYVQGANRALEPCTQSQMQDMRYKSSDASGDARFYAVVGSEIEIYPSPSSGTLEMTYMSKIEALSDSNTSNWILTYHPDAYLYGSLVQSAPYLKDDERLQTWVALFNAAISAINQDGQESKWGGEMLRSRKVRS